jgi:hypothetical protein
VKLVNLNGILKYLKSKYSNVRIYKKDKKNIFIYIVFEVTSKNNKKLYYFAVLDKKNDLYTINNKESFRLIAKNKINEKIKESKKYLNFVKNSQKKENIRKNEILKKKPTPKNNKKNKSKRFKNEKEYLDWNWIWTIIRFGLMILDSEKEYFDIKEVNGILKILRKNVKIPKEELLVYKIYSRLVNITKDEGLYAETTRGALLEARFNELYKKISTAISQKAKNKNFYFSDLYHFFYMIMLWQNNVKNKKIDTVALFSKEYLQNIYEIINKFEELADNRTDKNITWKVLDNSTILADMWFNENYKNIKEINQLKVGTINE